MNRANSGLAAADVKLKQVYEESDNFMNGIYSLFSAYERKAQDLLHGDLEEITRLKNPDKPTRIAMYTVGFLLYLFNILIPVDAPDITFVNHPNEKYTNIVVDTTTSRVYFHLLLLFDVVVSI
jgi:hypothetical protein